MTGIELCCRKQSSYNDLFEKKLQAGTQSCLEIETDIQQIEPKPFWLFLRVCLLEVAGAVNNIKIRVRQKQHLNGSKCDQKNKAEIEF